MIKIFTDFEFDGERASDYGLIVGNFNHTDIETLSSSFDISYNQLKPSGRDTFNLYASYYENPYTYTFQIIKNPCKSDDGEIYLSPYEVSYVQKWLCRRNEYKKFKINANGYENIYWMVVFSAKQIILNSKIVGLELTFISESPYAYLEPVKFDFDCKENIPFEIYDASDEKGFIHPDMEITCLKESDSPYTFTLSNSQDNKIMKIDGCTKNEIITIYGKNLIINTSKSSHVSLSKDFNYFFPKIINKYNDNNNIFTPNIDCNIKFTYSPIRKVGLP